MARTRVLTDEQRVLHAAASRRKYWAKAKDKYNMVKRQRYREACLKRRQAVNDSFLLDFENWVLENRWEGEFPTGPDRYLDPEWARVVKYECEHLDCSWPRYCAWVRLGGGDDPFLAPL